MYLLLRQAPDCRSKKTNEKVVHTNLKHDCCKYDTVSERTVETLKAVRVLKTFYKRDNEHKICRVSKQFIKNLKDYSRNILLNKF